jgi:autotransporter family porin
MTRNILTASSDAARAQRARRAFRNRLALTTVLTVAPLMSYGRQAEAACAVDPVAPTYSCSGASGAQSFLNIDSVALTTVAGFSVTAVGADNGITITGDGQLSYIDTNASPITSENGIGLSVHATGNIVDEITENGGVAIDTNGNISGATGIAARNDGAGDVLVRVSGAVSGRIGDGIHARNSGNDLTVVTGAGAISGADDGIDALNEGNGELTVEVGGQVTGGNYGVIAVNRGSNLKITAGAQSAITGGDTGIIADNQGDGYVDVKAYGRVTGGNYSGVLARNEGTDLTITTGVGSVIVGRGEGGIEEEEDAGHGIDAYNNGSGNLKITANGEVTGLDGNGIHAGNSRLAIDLTIITGAQSVISGSENGIYARNYGTGDLDITVDGRVTGLGDDGIDAMNGVYLGYEQGVQGANLTVRTGDQSVVVGRDDGIDADNEGLGKLEISVNGTAIGLKSNGIEADNSEYGTDLEITTGVGSVVRGGDDGIDAENDGDGELIITVNGRVTGMEGDGIYAENGGSGETRIKIGASGVVEGADTGIDVEADNGEDIWITNYGTVRNLSGASADVAIETRDGDTEFDNYGALVGVVRFNSDDDRVTNKGYWNTAGGTNEFGLDTDRVNNEGVLVAANDALTEETTEFLDLEYFNNNGGLISLADGEVGDLLRLRGEIESLDDGPLRYSADDGRLVVDTRLGAGAAGESDVVEIIGNVDEDSSTTIAVNVVGASGVNLLGIPVVKVIDGDTGPDNFSLAGPVHGGLFAWDLRFDDENNWYELFTSGVGIGGYEMAAGLTGAQDIWHQTTGTLAQRQGDLRPALTGTQVTPVADFAEPVAPTAAGRVGPGFWFNAVGGWLDRDAESDGYTLDRKQSIYGGLAGFDFATDGDANGTWLFGLFGGYLSSTLKFSETNSKWTYDGPTVGAYATYLNDAFYADVTVKADFLSIDIEQEDLGADDSDTDGINLGGRIDAGYKIGTGGGAFVEPQATLAVVNTDIDDAEVGGGDVDFDNETSVKGRLGLKLGYDHTASNAMIFSSDLTASVWQEFNGGNDVTVSAAGLGDFGVSDDAIGTLGDISLGFSVTATEGWTGFLRANYQFAEDFEAITGNAGLRYSW